MMLWGTPKNLASSASVTVGATSFTIASVSLTKGQLIVLTAGIETASTVTGFTVADGTNTYTVYTEANPATLSGYAVVAYCVAASTASVTITVTRTGSGNITQAAYGVMAVTAGNKASSPEDTGVKVVANGTSTAPSVTGGAGSAAADLLIGVTGWITAVGVSYTEDATHNWTNFYNLNNVTSGNSALGVGYKINTGTSGTIYNPTLSTSEKWAVIQVGFTFGGPASAAFDTGVPATFYYGRSPHTQVQGAQPLGASDNLNVLKGQDRMWGGPGEVPDFDWPNPHNSIPANRFYSYSAQPLGAPLLLGPFTTPTPPYIRGPLITAIWAPLPHPDTQPLGTPDTIVAVPSTPPFAQYDWPVPRGPQPYDRALFSQQNGIDPFIAGQDQLPFNQKNWPNPTLRLSELAAMWAQLLGSARILNLLLGQDQFYGAPGEVIAYDWPVPAGPPKWLVSVTAQTFGTPTTLFETTAAPFSQHDWPNPRGPQQPTQTQPYGTATNLTELVGQDVLPFNKKDWPNPVLRVDPYQSVVSQPLGSPDNITLLPGQDRLPFRQADWPNPRGSQQPTQTQPYGTPLNLTTLVGQDVLPKNQYNWPNPVLRLDPYQAVVSQPEGTPDNLTLLVGQDQLPFRQTDWPNPRGSLQPTQTQPLGLLATITPQPAAIILPIDWPNPRGPQQPTQTQPYGSALILTTLVGLDILPENQKDWPNPKGPQQPNTYQPVGSPLILTTLRGQDVLPKNQKDWPNPVLRIDPYRAVVSQPVGSALVLTTLRGQDVLPNNKKDWPNPILRISSVAAIEAQREGSPLNLTTLVGQDKLPKNQLDWPLPPRGPQQPTQTQPYGYVTIPPPPPPPPTQKDWPNPVLRIDPYRAVFSQPQGAYIFHPGANVFINLVAVSAKAAAAPFASVAANPTLVEPCFSIMRNKPVPSQGEMDNVVVAAQGIIEDDRL